MTGSKKGEKAVVLGGAVATAGLVAAGAVTAVAAPAASATQVAAHGVSAAAMPRFRLPFPCGQTWTGSSRSSAHTGYEIDFNWGRTAEADNGKPVVAAAAGKVIRSEYSRTSGYGYMIYIRHSGGYVTRYAHLKKLLVRVGATVKKGQRIGQVGKSSAKYRIASHLHFELRNSSGRLVPAYFEGKRFRYPTQKLTACRG